VTDGQEVAAPAPALDGIQDQGPGLPRLGPRLVVAQLHARLPVRAGQEGQAPGAQAAGRLGFRQGLDAQGRVAPQGGGPGAARRRHHADLQALRRPESRGQQDGEDEHPEDGLGLSYELAEADQRELDEGMAGEGPVSHRAGAGR
jgi:hypothetical protein